MENPRIFKQITPTKCPHCNEEIFIGTQAMMPSVISTNTYGQIKEVRETIKKRLEEIAFASEEEKMQVIKYLDDKNTLLGSSDIEPLIKQISVDQAQKKTSK